MQNLKDKIKTWFFRKLFTYLKARFWGVGFELQLPPEFVIGRHAELRLNQRTPYRKHEMPALAVRAWYEGGIPPSDFQPHVAVKPDTYVFRKYVYKKYGSYIFVFGLMHKKLLSIPQKHLITIYNWQ